MNPFSTEVHAMNAVRSNGWAGRVARIAATVALVAPIVNCTSRQNTGTSPSYLIVDSLVAASGAVPTTFSGTLSSDVVTKGSIFADLAQVTLRVALKDPGSQTTPNQPTTMNFVTVTRYHVRFFRTDGRNTPGVDVPQAFDGVAQFAFAPK